VSLTRRQLLGAAAAGGLATVGIYELVDRFTQSPARPPAGAAFAEQHLLDSVRVVVDNDVEVLVPPLHHEVVTARLGIAPSRQDLVDARATLEQVLARVESEYPTTPAGLGMTLGWGLPYFERHVPAAAGRHLPIDVRASSTRGRRVLALENAIRFPSDPASTLLEDNDLALLLRSDSLAHIAAARKAVFQDLGLFDITSVRRGFAGGGFEGEQSLPKQMAMAAGVAGAELIPDTAELFLGFTSTQRQGLGPTKIANLETLGYADLRESGYFAHGTHMHLSHMFEDLASWYQTFDHQARVDTTFRPGLEVPQTVQTVPQGPDDTQTAAEVERDYAEHRRIGHSGSIQPASRLLTDVVGSDGTRYPKGTAVPQRADFNTLDNPFAWSADPARDGFVEGPAAGLHFVVFTPTSDDFRRVRLSMDGVLPNGTKLAFEEGTLGRGFNQVLKTTHRQNFLVPPRKARSFPLAEL
jgi:hypothetical protein